MPKYAFILGRNPQLSVAEIKAILPTSSVINQTDSFFILDAQKEFDCINLLDRLGGTIKIGRVLAGKIDKNLMIEILKKNHSGRKLNFGLSYYQCPPDKKGLELKQALKQAEISSRLVTSKDQALSSVVVKKNKVFEFLILENKWLAQTCAVQEFEKYSQRDFGRPARDTKSGTLPPKLAKIMINLSQSKPTDILLDPFCGSGTILQEALLLGYKNVVGSDVSDKAVRETKQNLDWLAKSHKVGKYKVAKIDVKNLNQEINRADVVVTEPYLGPALKGSESKEQIKEIIAELSPLYLGAFDQFKKILKPSGRVVIIFPWFKKFDLKLEILPAIKKIGFDQLNFQDLIYSRVDQKVYRQVFIFQKS